MGNKKPEKKEFDADEVIRDYVESDKSDDDGNQTRMEWYEQAAQDTTVPPEAVLTGGDIDAAWDQAAVGEETVGGTTPTPDQDIVDELGRAVGVNYEDAEPLHTTEKLERLTGWRASIGFEDGLERTVAWYRDNEAWWRGVLGRVGVSSS